VQRDTSPPSAPLVFFTFMMPLASVTNWEPHGVKLAGCCYAMGNGMKVQIVSPCRVGNLKRYGVTVRGNVTSAYPPLYFTLLASVYQSVDAGLLVFVWYTLLMPMDLSADTGLLIHSYGERISTNSRLAAVRLHTGEAIRFEVLMQCCLKFPCA
jgi:hypothetical protein